MDNQKDFIRALTGIELHPQQKELLEKLGRKSFTYISYPTYFGTTTCLANYVILKCLERKQNVFVSDGLYCKIDGVLKYSQLEHRHGLKSRIELGRENS